MTSKRVLYIEDNFQNKRLIKKILAAKGYEVLEAEDGLQGIALAARERPDLILMDINIPGIDGMEATSRLKNSPDLSHIPVVALTANAMRGDREKIMAAGCDEYLQKPVNSAKLVETIKRFIGESKATPQCSPGKANSLIDSIDTEIKLESKELATKTTKELKGPGTTADIV